MISIVIPSFNEEENITLLYDQIKASMSAFEYECIFVDDGSNDRTFKRIKDLAKEDNRVKGISFSRNFGHQVALLAGITETKGEIIVSLDADGQHPPHLIPGLIKKMEEGYDIVNKMERGKKIVKTRRLTTKDAGKIKNATSKWYYRLINMLTDVRIEPASSDFRAMSRKATDAFLLMDEKDRFTRGLVSWMGFNQAIIEFDAPSRMTGASKYTFKKMLRFAWDGITSFSSKPLKFSLYVGLFSLFFGILYSIYAVIVFCMGNTIPGWTSMMLAILILGGIQLMSLGIIGEYLSRIFTESKNRPHYFINEKC